MYHCLTIDHSVDGNLTPRLISIGFFTTVQSRMNTPFKLGRDSAGQVMIRGALDKLANSINQRLVGSTQVYFLDEIIQPPVSLEETLKYFESFNFVNLLKNSTNSIESISGTV